MVFESLVVELINRYLGDFVENLDTSQLKIGIWGGDVVLNNLNLKESALDDLDLPLKIKAGHIRKLVLKIPWKNLYTEAVVTEIDGVYALAVPNVGIRYDAEKDELEQQSSKQKKLARIEEMKRLDASKGDEDEAKADSFAEKLATQVIKNLQVKVTNIHIRYEDRFTNPRRPFSCGVCLQELRFQTTDENWKECLVKESVSQIYKLVKLDSLSAYWNSFSSLLESMERPELLDELALSIAGQRSKDSFHFIVRPITSVAHLRLNTRPELTEFTVPKVGLTVVFDELAVGLSKDQYDDILEMLESLERMSLLSTFRNYRPDIPLHRHAGVWWRYAYSAVLKESVRRRRRMWSWSHIVKHRTTMREYCQVYAKKLDSRKLSAGDQRTLDECERILDVFSITLVRQQAEVEAAKMGARRREAEASKGWFSGWFWSSEREKSVERDGNEGDMESTFYRLYNADEKARLYNAIGYEENEALSTFPIEFEAVKVVTKFKNMTVFLRHTHPRELHLLNLHLSDVCTQFFQRPSAGAVRIHATVNTLTASGACQNGVVPKLVMSQVQADDKVFPLLSLALETHPLHARCDTSVDVDARPLEIVYDAVTVNRLADFFTPPESVRLKQFSQAAMAKFDDIKEQSTTGIQHALEQHSYTEISLNLMSSYVLIPEGGLMTPNVCMLVLDLGQLEVTSEKHDASVVGKETLEKKMLKAYDKFSIKLSRIQLLFVEPGTDWYGTRRHDRSPMHILSPISVMLDVGKCIFANDPRMPRMKVCGLLPSITAELSDVRIKDIIRLLRSIPLPEPAPVGDSGVDWDGGGIGMIESKASKMSTNVIHRTTTDCTSPVSARSGNSVSSSAERVNFTNMELVFEIKEVAIQIRQQSPCGVVAESPVLLKASLLSLSAALKMRTFDTVLDAFLRSVDVQQLQHSLPDTVVQQLASVSGYTGSVVNLVSCPNSSSQGKHLVTVHVVQADRRTPDFYTTYNGVEQAVNVDFGAMDFLLHQKSVSALVIFGSSLSLVEPVPATVPTEPSRLPIKDDCTVTKTVTSRISMQSHTAASKASVAGVQVKKTERRHGVHSVPASVVCMKIEASMCHFSVSVCTDIAVIANVQVKGMELGVITMREKIVISAVMRDMTVFDPDPTTFHTKILQIEGSEVLNVGMTVCTGGTDREKYFDMKCFDASLDVSIGCIHVFFLNKFVNRVLDFAENFQAETGKQVQAAGQAVAQAGRDAVQSLQERSTRIALNVRMKAPVIVVPKCSTSLEGLLVDLGQLSLDNVFSVASRDDLSSSGLPPVLERMHIELTSLSLARVLLSDDGQVGAACLLLEPSSVSIAMTRNLSAAWYHRHADVELNVSLMPLTVRLSQGDYNTVIQVLAGNFGERANTADVAFHADDVAKEVDTVDSTVAVKSAHDADVKTPDTYTSLKVNFQLTAIYAYLYSGDSDLIGQVGSMMPRDPARCLGKFEIQTLAAEVAVCSDSSIGARVFLSDAILDDMRREKQTGITRMVQRRNDNGSHGNKMVAIDFKQTAMQEKTVGLTVSSVYVCVCTEFLLTIGHFFTAANEDTVTLSAPSGKNPSAANSKPVSSAVKPTVNTEAGVAVVGSLDVALDMDKPEVILIEDQMNVDTKALALDMVVKFRLIQNQTQQVISGSISALEIFSCTFSNRHCHLVQVLSPCDVMLHSSSKHGKDPCVAVDISDVVLKVSPAVIETIAAVSSNLARTSVTTVVLNDECVPVDVWAAKKLEDCDFWFLSKNNASPLGETSGRDRPQKNRIRPDTCSSEQLVLSLPSLAVKLEAGILHRTVPLLMAECSFRADVHNWSSALQVEGSVDVEVGYYNEKLSVWEPLIEPVTEENSVRRWQIRFEVHQNDDSSADSVPGEDEVDARVFPSSKMVVDVTSSDPLQLVLSKTCLDVLTNLGKAFNDAYNLITADERRKKKAFSPYIFINQTGYEILLELDPLMELDRGTSQEKVTLMPDQPLPVYLIVDVIAEKNEASLIKATQDVVQHKISFQVDRFGHSNAMTLKRSEKRVFDVGQSSEQAALWSVLCWTDCSIGQTTVLFQSVVSIRNDLSFSVQVHYRGVSQVESCGVITPGSSTSLPLIAVYALYGDLFFTPVGDRCGLSDPPFQWRATQNGDVFLACCQAVDNTSPACYFSVFTVNEDVFYEHAKGTSVPCRTLHLQHSVVLHNLLPLDVRFLLEGEGNRTSLPAGENTPLMHAQMDNFCLEIAIVSYQGLEWFGHQKLDRNLSELTTWEFTAVNGIHTASMELGLRTKLSQGSLDISLFAPYWLVNKTGRKLEFKSSDSDPVVTAERDGPHLSLFSFRGRMFFADKKTVQMRIDDLEWSDKFSLDTVGSSGSVSSKSKLKDVSPAEVGVSNVLSSCGLTKIVTFTPFYMFLNKSKVSFLVAETDVNNWIEIEPGQCIAFWPHMKRKEISVLAMVKATSETTRPFCINWAHSTLMKLDNEYGGIHTECQSSDSCMTVTLKTYHTGLGTVQVVNDTHTFCVTFHQSGEDQEQFSLASQETLLYTWSSAMGVRELVWSCGAKSNVSNNLLQDGIGDFRADDNTLVYWICLLSGLQRILLFTESPAAATAAQEVNLEQMDMEINLEINGLGLSLINDFAQCEVAFMGVTSSGILWEECKRNRCKALDLKECFMLEDAWQRYETVLALGKQPLRRVVLPNKMEVDFVDMTVIKPKTFAIRRSFRNGVWLQYKTSCHQVQFHALLNHLQLDNQLSQAIFTTVFSPLPPPRSVAADSVPKPFAEVSVMICRHTDSPVAQVKYFKVLVQEMSLNVDQGFLSALLALFTSSESLPRGQETIQLRQDVSMTERCLMELAGLSLAEEQKNFYDYLHFSPLKIHLSFSLQTGTNSGDKPVEIQVGLVKVFLQSVGVVLTDIQDVVFKMGYFERCNGFYNHSQLVSQLISHYTGQAVKQAYVLVLGLDVLGNPFGLLRGLSEGVVDLFYEPYQGVIQGPEEFVEGLRHGVRSLLGHAVGGAAGAVSRITGTLGKGLATLTLDDDYQRKRREQLNKRPASALEGFARGGKGLVEGVFDGVTGIVRQPVKGAMEEGVSGFFKGVGKGLVGVVTRPTSGVVDFASSSFEGIRRFASVHEEIRRLRPPRRFFKDRIIRPYHHQEAEGYAILMETEKGLYADSDEYEAHLVVSRDGRSVFLVTNRRVMLIKRGEIFGGWDVEWAFTWLELREDTPKKTSRGIDIVLKEKEKRKKLFSSGTIKKELSIPDPVQAEWIIRKIAELRAKMTL